MRKRKKYDPAGRNFLPAGFCLLGLPLGGEGAQRADEVAFDLFRVSLARYRWFSEEPGNSIRR